MTAIIALGSIIVAINLLVGFSLLVRIRANQRRDRATLSRIMARGVSVERRAMAEWIARP